MMIFKPISSTFNHTCCLASRVISNAIYSSTINKANHTQFRSKHTKTTSYRMPARSGVYSRNYEHRPHIGIRTMSAEYVETGRTVVKQRKYIGKNPNATRLKHFKLYPGENVKVVKDTSLVAICSGRVKFTHDVVRGVKIANVLPEMREEIREEDLWRYRTEHVRNIEENKVLCSLRQKALPVFSKTWVSPPVGIRPMPDRISYNKDSWNNPHIQDPLEFVDHPYPITNRALLRKKMRERSMNVTTAMQGLKGLSAQR